MVGVIHYKVQEYGSAYIKNLDLNTDIAGVKFAASFVVQ